MCIECTNLLEDASAGVCGEAVEGHAGNWWRPYPNSTSECLGEFSFGEMQVLSGCIYFATDSGLFWLLFCLLTLDLLLNGFCTRWQEGQLQMVQDGVHHFLNWFFRKFKYKVLGVWAELVAVPHLVNLSFCGRVVPRCKKLSISSKNSQKSTHQRSCSSMGVQFVKCIWVSLRRPRLVLWRP